MTGRNRHIRRGIAMLVAGAGVFVAAAAQVAGAGVFVAAAAQAADITVQHAWMRPAAAMTTAKVYVEITSDTALELTGATSPLAKQINFIQVDRPGGTDEGRVVKALSIPAAATTRLAYLGSHLRFVDLVADVANSSIVPLTLEFTDAGGRMFRVPTTVEVRGVLRPQGGAPSASPAGATGSPSPSPHGSPTGSAIPDGRTQR